MIKIKIKENQITISGHSGYDELGKDIVCASVSTLAITSVNAILRFDDKAINYKDEDGYLEINIIKHSKETDTIIENMITLLTELEKEYKKYIKIYREV